MATKPEIRETYTRDGRIVYFIRTVQGGRPVTRPIKAQAAFDMLNRGEAIYAA